MAVCFLTGFSILLLLALYRAGIRRLCDSVFEAYVPLEVTNKEYRKYVTNSIEHLEAMEAEIKKCRKNVSLGLSLQFLSVSRLLPNRFLDLVAARSVQSRNKTTVSA